MIDSPVDLFQEARRFCHGVPLLKPDFNESPEAGYAYGYECKKFQLNIINYTGTSPSLSTPSTAHSTSTDCLSKLIPRRLCDTRSYLRDVIASEARLLLSALLHELQEGLVVKLLLPTEPTTPALPTSISVSRINSRTDNRASFLAATSQQDCWQENRPLLQRFKNLFSFGDKSHTNEPQLKSPDSVAYGNDDFLSSSRTLLGNNLVTVEEILSVKHGQNLPQNHDLNHLYPPNIVIASSAGDYDYDSQFSDGLQPISPICSGEDVTSVQLLLIRIHLDSHISSQTTSNKVDIIEYFTAAVTIDYAIKLQGSENGKQRDTGTCVESLISSVDNDSYTFKNARIASLPCQSKSPQTPFKIMAMPLDKKLPSIDERLSAAIALSTQCSTYEVAVELDFEFLLAELMTIVSNTLRSMST